MLEKVYIVVGPQSFKDYDPFKEEQLELEVKLSALDGIESEWRALNENGGGSAARRRLGDRDGDEYYPSYSNWMSYGTSFIGTIVENLQVQIRDVHIRYEDDISFSGGSPTGLANNSGFFNFP